MDDAKNPQTTSRSWVSALKRAEADRAAGRIVEGTAVHRLLDEAEQRIVKAGSKLRKTV